MLMMFLAISTPQEDFLKRVCLVSDKKNEV
jgi:hypothetical protein